MSDLSRLLDDVYRPGAPAAEPAWSSDRALDDAFEHWVPGPPAEAPAEERSYAQDWAEVAGTIPEATTGPDAAAAFSAALGEQQPAPTADPFGPLHALLEEAIRLAPAADGAAPEPAPDREPVPGLFAFLDTEPTPAIASEPEPEPTVEVVEIVEVVEVAAPAFVAPVPVTGWTRSDDDILPAGRTSRGVKLRRRRRS